jgi:hypothetical protein
LSTTAATVIDCRPDPANLVTQAKLDAFFEPKGTAGPNAKRTAAARLLAAAASADVSNARDGPASTGDVAAVSVGDVAAAKLGDSLQSSPSLPVVSSSQLPMSEVVAMVERGERPGIRDDVPRDALSAYQPQTTTAQAASPPKPWEAAPADRAAEVANAAGAAPGRVTDASVSLGGTAAGVGVAGNGEGGATSDDGISGAVVGAEIALAMNDNPERQRSDRKKGGKKGSKGKPRSAPAPSLLK